MIQKIKGYKYADLESVLSGIDMLNKFYGIPKSEDSVTKTWCEHEVAELDNQTFYFIRYDKSMLQVLGEPEEFDVVFDAPDIVS